MKTSKANNHLNTANLTKYFKSFIRLYKTRNSNCINRFSFSSLLSLPLILSDRIMYSILDADKASSSIFKDQLIDNLVKFYLGDTNYQRTKILSFLDNQSKGFINKKDVTILAISFHSFLNFPMEEKNMLLGHIDDIFQKEEVIYYGKEWSNNNYLTELISLFHLFIFQVVPLAEYTQYFTMMTGSGICDEIRQCETMRYGKRCNSFVRERLRHQSWLTKSLESYNNNDEEEDEEEEDKDLIEYELSLHESDRESTQENSQFSDYNGLAFKGNYSSSNDVSLSKKISIEFISRKYRKKMSFERYLPLKSLNSITSLNTSDINKSDTSLGSDFYDNNNNNLLREYSFHLLQDENDLKQYKFLIDDKYIYYYCSKKRNEIIPVASSYCDDIKQIIIKSKKLYTMTIICCTLLQIFNLELYTQSKDDLLKFKSVLGGYSQYKNINDYYHITEPIGKGNYATVYLATDNSNENNTVAIKVIERKSYYNVEQFEMMQNECDIFRYLLTAPHPNIIKGIDYFESINHIYLVYEYLPRRFIDVKHYEDTIERNSRYIKQIADAIGYLHSNGIIHRDIKPDNILIDEEDNIKLIDLGFGAIMTSSDTLKNRCGTPIATAPEILKGKPYGKKCDIWSLGIVAYYIEYGYYPFEAKTMEEIVSKILKGTFQWPTSGENHIKTKLDCLIEKCLIVEETTRIELVEIMEML